MFRRPSGPDRAGGREPGQEGTMHGRLLRVRVRGHARLWAHRDLFGSRCLCTSGSTTSPRSPRAAELDELRARADVMRKQLHAELVVGLPRALERIEALDHVIDQLDDAREADELAQLVIAAQPTHGPVVAHRLPPDGGDPGVERRPPSSALRALWEDTSVEDLEAVVERLQETGSQIPGASAVPFVEAGSSEAATASQTAAADGHGGGRSLDEDPRGPKSRGAVRVPAMDVVRSEFDEFMADQGMRNLLLAEAEAADMAEDLKLPDGPSTGTQAALERIAALTGGDDHRARGGRLPGQEDLAKAHSWLREVVEATPVTRVLPDSSMAMPKEAQAEMDDQIADLKRRRLPTSYAPNMAVLGPGIVRSSQAAPLDPESGYFFSETLHLRRLSKPTGSQKRQNFSVRRNAPRLGASAHCLLTPPCGGVARRSKRPSSSWEMAEARAALAWARQRSNPSRWRKPRVRR